MTIHTRIIMGMPIFLHLPEHTSTHIMESAFDLFAQIDEKYSPYISTSEVSRIQQGNLSIDNVSNELSFILRLAHAAKNKTDGYFDVMHKNVFDPSGIVKGWAISEVVKLLNLSGVHDFIVDAGGDMYCAGKLGAAQWKVGIRAPLEPSKVVKELSLSNMAIATSGITERGQHIYNPKSDQELHDLLSISVIGPDIIWADVYATAAFAMGKKGIDWVEALEGYEAFAIYSDMTGVPTSGFKQFIA